MLRSLGYTSEQIVETFFDNVDVTLTEEGFTMTLVPSRLRGETATFDIVDQKGSVLVEEGRRVTARHIKQMEKIGLKQLQIPEEYLVGKKIARDQINPATGELICDCNTEVTQELLVALRVAGITALPLIYSNDLDCGPFMSDTLTADPTRTQLEALVEIYRMMRPGEPPTKESAENLFNNLFFTSERYDLSAVGRMKFNRRLGRSETTGEGVLGDEDIVA